jgi:hypothetical protein
VGKAAKVIPRFESLYRRFHSKTRIALIGSEKWKTQRLRGNDGATHRKELIGIADEYPDRPSMYWRDPHIFVDRFAYVQRICEWPDAAVRASPRAAEHDQPDFFRQIGLFRREWHCQKDASQVKSVVAVRLLFRSLSPGD